MNPFHPSLRCAAMGLGAPFVVPLGGFSGIPVGGFGRSGMAGPAISQANSGA